MIRYYEGDQDKIFEEAQTINPFRLKGKVKIPKISSILFDWDGTENNFFLYMLYYL